MIEPLAPLKGQVEEVERSGGGGGAKWSEGWSKVERPGRGRPGSDGRRGFEGPVGPISLEGRRDQPGGLAGISLKVCCETALGRHWAGIGPLLGHLWISVVSHDAPVRRRTFASVARLAKKDVL